MSHLPTDDNDAHRVSPEWSEGRMYAICFDLMGDALERHYPGGDTRNAYGDIRRVLVARGFWTQQGSVYFSNHRQAVEVWTAIQELQERYGWFSKVVRDLRMLRIEENNNLMPLLRRPTLPLDFPPLAAKPTTPGSQARN